jgi:hypothetical protein
MHDSGWSPTSMPRRETQHAFLHPDYIAAANATKRPAPVVEERMADEYASVSVEPAEDE